MAFLKAVLGSWWHFLFIKIVCAARTGLAHALCRLWSCHSSPHCSTVTGRDCLASSFFSFPVGRAQYYMYLILYKSVMLYNSNNVLMTAKAFQLWLGILHPLFLSRNDALRNIHKHFLATIFPVLLSFAEEGECSVDCPLSFNVDSRKQDILGSFNYSLDYDI